MFYIADAVYGMTLEFQLSSNVEEREKCSAWSSCLTSMNLDHIENKALANSIALKRLLDCFSEQRSKRTEETVVDKRVHLHRPPTQAAATNADQEIFMATQDSIHNLVAHVEDHSLLCSKPVLVKGYSMRGHSSRLSFECVSGHTAAWNSSPLNGTKSLVNQRS